MLHIWTLSLAGNFATKTQTTALAEALRLQIPAADQVEINSFVPFPPDGKIINDNKTVIWPEVLSPEQLAEVKCEDGRLLMPPWPDIVVSCRPEVAALALGIKKASDGQTKVIHIQNPTGPIMPISLILTHLT